ncbi:MAG: DUF4157 domain-containing protein [Proteobacteria bacterium]|nr:DUF4157 domain-containing protein [Pseudomonadota bacterium]
MKHAPKQMMQRPDRTPRRPVVRLLPQPAPEPAPVLQLEESSELEHYQQGAGNAAMAGAAQAATAQGNHTREAVLPTRAALFEATRLVLQRKPETGEPGQPSPASCYDSIIALAQRPNTREARAGDNGGDRPSVQAKPDTAVNALPVQQWNCSEYGQPTCTESAGDEADATAPEESDVVQSKCSACEAEQAEQAASAADANMVPHECSTCEEEGSDGGAPVQLWNCREYGQPNCVQSKEDGHDNDAGQSGSPGQNLVQAKCPACEAKKVAQKKAGPKHATGPGAIQQSARKGLAGANQPLPHLERIQASFGRHDISNTRARVGGAAAEAGRDMGALAFTSGNQIGFRQAPDVRLAAHEAAHVVQQREGLSLPGNVGRPGDQWERNADQVADAVVAGRSAEPLLDSIARPSGGGDAPVQRQITSGAARQIELPPTGETGPAGGAAAEAWQGEGGGAAASAPPPTEEQASGSALEQSEQGDSEEQPADPGGEGQGGEAQGGEQPTGRGGRMGECYRASAEPPPDNTPEPSSDAPSSEVEEDAAVAFPPWQDGPDECEVAEALDAQAQQIPGELQGGPATQALAQQGADTAQGSADENAVAALGAPSEGALGGAATVPSAEGQFSSMEGQRDRAVAEYLEATSTLASVPARAQQLGQRVTFQSRHGGMEEELARISAMAQVDAFMDSAANQIRGAVAFVQNQVPARLGLLADSTKASIATAMEVEKAAISARINSARGQAMAQADAAREQILAEYRANVATIHTETDAAIATLEAEYMASGDAIASQEEAALEGVNTRFATGRAAHEAKGPEYGDRALARGQQHVEAYEHCKTDAYGDFEGNYSDDGFWTGCLTVRRARAQQDAACKTASGYKDNLIRTAHRKAYELKEQRTQYRCAVIAGAQQVSETLDDTLEQLIAGLEAGRARALGGISTARNLNLSAIDRSLAATSSTLDRQEYTQRQAINDSGYCQQVAIEQLAHATAAGLARGVSAAMDSLEATLSDLRRQLESGEVPDPMALASMLAAAEQGLSAGMGSLLGKMEEGASNAEAQIGDAGWSAFEALRAITTSNDELAIEVESGFSGQMADLVAAAASTMADLTDSHVQQAKDTAAQGVTTMTQLVQGYAESITTIYTRVDEALAASLEALDQELEGMLGQLDDQIIAQAWRAAEREQPAWKGVLAIVLIVFVVIASVVVSVLTLGAGAPFLAVVLVGAIVGAISAGLIQIINNWASGQEWHQGLVQAVIMGAVGGALGGGIGFGAGAAAGALSAGAGAVARTAINIGVNLAGDMISEGLTQAFGYFVFGQKFNWQGFVMAGGMSVVSSARARPGAGSADLPAGSGGRTGGARDALIEVGAGIGLAGGVEILDVLTGGSFDFNRFASAAASGAAGARAASRGAGTRTPAAEVPTTGLGRLRSRAAGLRDRAFSGLSAFESAVVARGRGLLGLPETPSTRRRAVADTEEQLHHAICGRCFPAGTKVLTPYGNRNIEHLRAGDLVVARHESGRGELAYREVLETFENATDVLLEITAGDIRIRTTPGHVVMAVGRGWILAEELKVGDELCNSEQQYVKITAIRQQEVRCTTFNLRVKGFQTYFVSNSTTGPGLWVHNTSAARILEPTQVVELTEPKTIISDPEVIRRVLGEAITARGGHQTPEGGFLQYLRRGGGAGFLGVTRDVLAQVDTVAANIEIKGGGILTVVDLRLVDPHAVWDLSDSNTMARMIEAYPRFEKMYRLMRSEGVVAIRHQIPTTAVKAIMNISGNLADDEIKALVRDLATSCSI